MFKGLRDKLKGALGRLSKQAEKEAKEVVKTPEQTQEKPKKTGTKTPKQTTKANALEKKQETSKKEKATPVAEKKEAKKSPLPPAPTSTKKEIEQEEKASTKKDTTSLTPETSEPEQEQKKSFFSRVKEKVTTIQLSEEKFEELFWDVELALLENNVAVEVIEKIKKDLQEELTTGRAARGGLQERVERRMQETLTEVVSQQPIDLLQSAQKHRPLIICVVGVNGSGKTTTIGKLGKYFQNNDKSVVFAAADTFRAAAIQQLQEHANNLNIPCIAQSYGADPAAVAFDAVKHAESKGIDIVLIDTAGRLHSNTNLMDELAKVVRVAKPHHTLFVGEAVTGNDCVEQARLFSEKTDVDGVILTKADVDDKGGAAVSVAYVTKKPILFLGTGQDYKDLTPFDPQTIVSGLLS